MNDDGREIVFRPIEGGKHELVTDELNRGTFNFITDKESSFGHALQDVVPWVLFGNSPEDPSNFGDRSLKLVEGGLNVAGDIVSDTVEAGINATKNSINTTKNSIDNFQIETGKRIVEGLESVTNQKFPRRKQ